MAVVKLNVQEGKGKNRRVVGTIEAREGVTTNKGRIDRVTPAGTVFTEDGGQYRNPQKQLTVAYSQAQKHGFPRANGCEPLNSRETSPFDYSYASGRNDASSY